MMGVMREIRIQNFMDDNLHCKYELMRTRGYAEAYVDGQMSIESKTKDLNKEKKMTREEAKKKLLEQRNNDSRLITHTAEDDFLNKCEALGLIKFEEEKKSNIPLELMDHLQRTVTYNGFELVLKEYGYKIVKKD